MEGIQWDGGRFEVKAEEAAAYAAATLDSSPAYPEIAPPMFHVRLMKPLLFMIANDPRLELDMLRLVHGEHAATFHRPLRHGDTVDISGRLLSLEDKPSGRVVTSALLAHVGGQLAVECRTVFFIRAANPPPSAPKAAAPAAEPPAPDWQGEVQVPGDASLVYAVASLDDNPIHTSVEVAQKAGFPGPILQGLCTMAMSVAEATRQVAGGDARRLRQAEVRFARPVLNGARLTVQGWRQGEGWSLRTLGPDGKPVIQPARVVFE